MRKLFILLSLLPVAVMANPAGDGDRQCGDKHHQRMEHRHAGDKPFFMQDLNLTETQQAQLKAMMEQRREERKTHKGQGREIKKAIHELTLSDNFNEADLEALVEQSMAMHKQRAMDRAKFQHEMFSILTAEQREQLKVKMAEFGKKMRH